MKRFFALTLLSVVCLVLSGCSILDSIPDKPVADPVDVEICDATGSQVSKTVRALEAGIINSDGIISTLSEANKIYFEELDKSNNRGMDEMLTSMINSGSKIIEEINQNRNLGLSLENMKESQHKWVNICTSLSEVA